MLVTWSRPSKSTSSHIYRLYRRQLQTEQGEHHQQPEQQQQQQPALPWVKVAEAKDITEATAHKLLPYTLYEVSGVAFTMWSRLQTNEACVGQEPLFHKCTGTRAASAFVLL